MVNSRSKRKTEMEPYAVSIGIPNANKFKTKILLWNKIKWVLSLKPENERDPLTLLELHEIDKNNYIEWIQDERLWGADVNSIKSLLAHPRNKNSILPWAVDFVVGRYSYETYLDRFDMRRNAHLMSQLAKFPENPIENTQNVESVQIVENSKSRVYSEILFEADKLTGEELYIAEIINGLLAKPFEEVYQIIGARLLDISMRLQQENSDEYLTFYNFCYLQYIVTGYNIQNVEENVLFVINCMRLFSTLATDPETNHNIIQILQYFFIDLV